MAASAAVIAMPIVATTATSPAAAAPAVSAQVTSVQAQPTSVAGLRASAINYANQYSRQARSSSPAQRQANARHLSALTHRARLHHTTRAVYIGRSLQGTPYRWGGTTVRGFDCSGFTQYVYRKSNKNIPRTTGQQRRASVPTRNPRPGDLVFFGGANPTHVGIYVGGNRMIHSPRSGRTVSVDRIWRGAEFRTVR
ncbi:MAG: C40 family peptidase [Mobilicoccus sp.]|nr:C40 family peptidase [Mobilicoccus sp.]